MLWVLVLVALAAAFYYFAIRPYNYWTKKGIKQGTPWPILGDNWGTLLQRMSFADMVTHVYKQVPNVRFSGFYQGMLPTLLLKDPELIKQITVKDFDHFLDHRSFLPEDADPLWSNNLFALKGQRWRDMRATLSPSFTSSKMKSMFTLMSDCSETFVKHFLDKKEKVVTVEMKDIFTRFANDIIATTAFGIKVNSIDEQENEFYLMGKEATNFSGFWKNIKLFLLILAPNLAKVLKLSFFSLNVTKFFYKLVGDTVSYREKNNVIRNDMIHLLMEARKGNQKIEESTEINENNFAAVDEDPKLKETVATRKLDITDKDIASQAMIFFFAGFDSVSGLMCFMSYELAVNSDIQERLREEVDEVILSEGKLTYEALAKMKYMDMVVSESMRKWPNAVAVDRVCTKPYTIESTQPGEPTVHLEKDDVVWVPIFGMHRDPQFFPDPEKFDPERFNSENKSKIVPYTYLPFGVGPRNCIGSRFALLETKAIFFHILTHFEIVPIEKTVIPLKISKKQFNLNSENGFWLGLKRRENTVR